MYLCICIYSYRVDGQGKRQPLNWLEMRPRLTLGQPEQNMVGGLKMITVRRKQSGTKRSWQLKRSGPDTFRQRLGSDFDRGATSHIFTFFWTCNPFYGSSIWMVGAFLLLRDTFHIDGWTRWLPATVCLVTMSVGWVRWMGGWVEVSVGNCEISKSKLRLAASFSRPEEPN